MRFSQRLTRQLTRGVSALRGLRYDYNLCAHKIVNKLLQIRKKSPQNRHKNCHKIVKKSAQNPGEGCASS